MTPPVAAGRRGRPWRLATRLAIRLAAVMLAAIALAAAGVAWRTVATIRSIDDAALQSQARLVAEAITMDSVGRPVVRLQGQLAGVFAQADSGSLFVVYDRADRPVSLSRPEAAALIGPFLPPASRRRFFRVPPDDTFPSGLLGISLPTPTGRVVVAQGDEQTEGLVDSLLQEFLASAVWLLVPICVLTLLIGVATIRSGLRPLRIASEAAGRVGADSPGLRLPETGLPDEALPLVQAVNAALGRLEDTLDAQRRFVGDAAHALRTPLAVLTARIDALPDGPETEGLLGDADRMGRLIGQMLAITRLVELPLDTTGPVDLRAICVEVMSELAPLAIRQGVELALADGSPCPAVSGNHAALALALGNLLQNAIAVAPPGSTVDVEVATPAAICVLDRGRGVAAAERAHIFERFGRAADAAPGGSGLGLAIVAEIARAHGGSVDVAAREGGGAVFTLRLRDKAAEAGSQTANRRTDAAADRAPAHVGRAGAGPIA